MELISNLLCIKCMSCQLSGVLTKVQYGGMSGKVAVWPFLHCRLRICFSKLFDKMNTFFVTSPFWEWFCSSHETELNNVWVNNKAKMAIPTPGCLHFHIEPKATLHLTNIKGRREREGRGKGKEGSRLVVPGNFMPLSAGNDSSEHTKKVWYCSCVTRWFIMVGKSVAKFERRISISGNRSDREDLLCHHSYQSP